MPRGFAAPVPLYEKAATERVGRVAVALVAASASFPLFRALEDENPSIVTISPGYREPLCFDTENNIARGRRG